MMMQEEQNLEHLVERERAVTQLEADIMDVNQIFKDLAAMVHDQGEMVDSIEANVETSSIRVNEGTEQLRQAERYQVRPGTCLADIISINQSYYYLQNKARKKKDYKGQKLQSKVKRENKDRVCQKGIRVPRPKDREKRRGEEKPRRKWQEY